MTQLDEKVNQELDEVLPAVIGAVARGAAGAVGSAARGIAKGVGAAAKGAGQVGKNLAKQAVSSKASNASIGTKPGSGGGAPTMGAPDEPTATDQKQKAEQRKLFY